MYKNVIDRVLFVRCYEASTTKAAVVTTIARTVYRIPTIITADC